MHFLLNKREKPISVSGLRSGALPLIYHEPLLERTENQKTPALLQNISMQKHSVCQYACTVSKRLQLFGSKLLKTSVMQMSTKLFKLQQI